MLCAIKDGAKITSRRVSAVAIVPEHLITGLHTTVFKVLWECTKTARNKAAIVIKCNPAGQRATHKALVCTHLRLMRDLLSDTTPRPPSLSTTCHCWNRFQDSYQLIILCLTCVYTLLYDFCAHKKACVIIIIVQNPYGSLLSALLLYETMLLGFLTNAKTTIRSTSLHCLPIHLSSILRFNDRQLSASSLHFWTFNPLSASTHPWVCQQVN